MRNFFAMSNILKFFSSRSISSENTAGGHSMEYLISIKLRKAFAISEFIAPVRDIRSPIGEYDIAICIMQMQICCNLQLQST